MKMTQTKQALLDELYKPYRSCVGCHFGMPPATQIVFGVGTPDSPLIFIGEAPGKEEDLQGKPFVGRSGKLLDRLLDAFGTSREKLFITNIVKCRPPNNRRPLAQEIEASRALLYHQIKIIRPKIICTLGSAALEGLLDRPVKITKERGRYIDWNDISVLPTYHPAFILRNPKELQTLANDIELALKNAMQV